MLTSRNNQLENDFQRLQLQHRNNQLALERLDEYEETISQLQEQLDQFRSNKKISSGNSAIFICTIIEIYFSDNDHHDKLRIENLERQIVELTAEVQSLEKDNCQLQQQFQNFQCTPGSPPSVNCRTSSPFVNLYDQFISLLPHELISSDKSHLSLSDRFTDLFEQFSSYVGTFSIVQEELDSLKQILNEKQDELEKLRTHFDLTTDKLTQFQEQQSLAQKNKSFDSDEDELDEILGFQHRAPSQQSLLSITPGEKQLLLAQNELLSSLFTEKERELIELQQVEKTHRSTCQQMEFERDEKLKELNDIRNVLDEKLRENSSLKKDKLFFIEKLAQLERERQEQQSIIQLPPKQSTPEREKSPPTTTTSSITPEQYDKLQSDYDELLQLSNKQHEESLSYYNEYMRIVSIYNELTGKYSQLQIEHESIQSIIQQKNEAYLQCQNELNTFQNLFYHQKKKSDDIDLLRSTLTERESQLQKLIDEEKQWTSKQCELENKLKFFEENQPRLEEIQLDLKRVTHERDLAIVERKQLEKRFEADEKTLLQLTDELEKKNRESENVKFEYARLEELNINRYEQALNEIRQHFYNEIVNRDSFIAKLQSEITQSNENFQLANNSRVEKQLVKNILLSYFHTPIDKQQEVVPLLGALVGFTQDEYQKAIDAINSNINGTGSWLTGWLGTSSAKTKTQLEAPVYHPDKVISKNTSSSFNRM